MTYLRDVGTRAKDHDTIEATSGMSKSNYLDERLDAPLLDRVVIDATGLVMSLHFDRPVKSAVDPTLGWTIVTDTVASAVVSGNRIDLTLTTGQTAGATCTVAYSSVTGDITSQQGVDLATFTAVTAINMSTA